jgi:hypothetical protein
MIEMEFPITRDRLQNYRANEAEAVETKQRVAKELKSICAAVEKLVLSSNERKYVYIINDDVKHGSLRPSNSPISLVTQKGIVKELIEAIKYIFPDSHVIIDPLETYILIDWF